MKADPEYSIKHYASIRDVPENVRRLFEVAGEKDFFLSADWFALFEAQIPGPDDRLYYYVASDEGGEPVVALPLMHAAGRGRTLTALTNFYSLSYGPVSATSGKALENALMGLFSHILAERPAWTSIRLEPIIGKGDLPELIARAAKKAGGFIATEQMSENWVEPINGRSADEYIADRPGRVRSTLKRKRRALERDHQMNLEICDSLVDLESAIDAYMRIYDKSWKEDEVYPDFIPTLIRLCAQQGSLRLAVLHVDGKPTASQFWPIQGKRAIIYKLSYDPEYSKFSPGSLLTEALARRCIDEDGVECIDFGLGADGYKKDWMSDCFAVHTVTVHNIHTIGGLLKAGKERLRQAVKSAKS